MRKKANRKPLSLSRPEPDSTVSNTSRLEAFRHNEHIKADQQIVKPGDAESYSFVPPGAQMGIKNASVCSEAQMSSIAEYGSHYDETAFPRSFDVDPKPDEPITGSGEKTAQIPGRKERILFVDDEEVLVIMVETMLRRLGYGVVSTTSSAEALRLFKEDPGQFDLVITDYTMPYLTGLALAKKLLTIRPDVPIILSTGFSETLLEKTAKRAGIKEVIQKPLVRREIAAVIRGVLNQTA